MRRVRYYEYGGPEVLTVEEADVPAPGPGTVLLHTEAIGANFVDTKFRCGPSSGVLFQRPLPLDLLAPFGRTVVYGAASGEYAGVSVMSLAALRTVAGFSLLAWRAAAPDQAREEMSEIARYAVDGRLRTAVHARLPLTAAAEAHRILEERTQLGRVLLVP